MDSSGAELLIATPAWLSGLASMRVLWDVISRSVLRLSKARLVSAGDSAEAARTMLPRNLNVGTAEIHIAGIEPIENGSRVELETPRSAFAAEVDNR